MNFPWNYSRKFNYRDSFTIHQLLPEAEASCNSGDNILNAPIQ